MERKTAVKEMYVISGGSIYMDKSMMTFHANMGEPVQLISTIYLIKTDNGNVLYDTGWSPSVVPMLAEMGLNPAIDETNSLPACLKRVGLTIDDIDTVILSHLHADHAGGIQFLPEAELVVQKDEYSYAFHPHSFLQLPYIKQDFDFPSYNWKFIDGDQVLMPGLSVVLADGHSPGFQALVVDLPESGPIVLADCSAPLSENIENEVIHGILWDPTRALHSLKRLKTLAEMFGGKVLPGHDIDFWSALKDGPMHFA